MSLIPPAASRHIPHPAPLIPSVELGVHSPVPDPIHLELKPQPGTIQDHLEREVQVVELDAPRRGQAGEEAARDGAQVRGQGADVDQVARVGLGRVVGLAGDEVVGDDERLARVEVARVVEGDGLEGGYRFALW